MRDNNATPIRPYSRVSELSYALHNYQPLSYLLGHILTASRISMYPSRPMTPGRRIAVFTTP